MTTVTCPAGTITGQHHHFPSIPYAAAPRPFEAAEQLSPGPIDARGSHLGLFLSVTQPPDSRYGSDHPVVVYIHGGSYDEGTRFEGWVSPELLASEGFVVVSIDYRLGLEGFVPFHDDEPNRYRGIDDCVLALEWIQRNIEHFGGDPTNVTLTGQSAGAGIVLWLMRHDHYRGGFRRAVALSPAFPRQPFERRKSALRIALRAPITRKGLSQLSPRARAKGYARYRRRIFNDLAVGPAPFDPGELASIPLIVSSTRDEMYARELGRKFDERGLGGSSLAAALLGLSKGARPTYVERAKAIDPDAVGRRMIGDSMIRRWVSMVAESTGCWMMEFTGPGSLHCADHELLFNREGAAHDVLTSFARGESPSWPAFGEDRTCLDISMTGEISLSTDPLKMVREAF